MKQDIFNKDRKSNNIIKILFADIVCFLLVTIFSVAFCYAYFSDQVNVSGRSTTAMVSISYQQDANTSIEDIYATINGTTQLLSASNNVKMTPGDTLNIKGLAVNNSTVGVFVLARLEILNKDSEGVEIDREIIWYNIENSNPLYVQRGLFQVGASELDSGESQEINIPYVFEGDRYTEEYANIDLKLILYSHQKDYLTTADDFDNYSAVNGYSASSIYATHYMTGRKRSLWQDTDADVSKLTINNLKTDNSGAYLINTCRDWMLLQKLSTEGNYFTNKIIKLNTYLDFNNITTAKTIDRLDAVFDGQGYTISNWKDEQGLFNNNYGNISNLGVDGLEVYKEVTQNETFIGAISGEIENASVFNCYVIGAGVYDSTIQYDMRLNVSGQDNPIIGGIVGKVFSGTTNLEYDVIVRNCYSLVNMAITGTGTNSILGGLIGATSEGVEQKLVANSYYIGNQYDAIGFGCGLLVGLPYCHLENSFAITESATNSHSNHITGSIDGEPIIINCAYIDNEESDNIVKVGENQTTKNLTENSFKSVGILREAFNWDTKVWGTNVYKTDILDADDNVIGDTSNNNGLPILRVFCNF